MNCCLPYWKVGESHVICKVVTMLVQWQKGHPAHKELVAFLPRGSLLEQMQEEIERDLVTGLSWKMADEMELIARVI